MEQELNTRKKCIKFLEELVWEGVPESPFDADSVVYKCANGKYKCKNTGKYFTVLTGTIFENTKVPITKWFKLIQLIIANRDGIPSTTAGNILGVTQSTAWNMLHKIRKVMGIENFQQLRGIVEADEFVAGGRLGNMHFDKKKKAKEKPYQNKMPCHGMVERNGNAVINVIPNMERDTLCARVLKYAKHGSVLYTDENPSYEKLNPFYRHDNVVHSKGNYVKKGTNIHTNTIESLWNTFSRTLKTYISVSPKYLQNYANESVFRYNTRKMNHVDACIWFLQNIVSSKITWRQIRLGQS